MSYAVTDAGEQEMRAELKVLDKLNEDIDQLASDARDCETVAPSMKTILDVAWWFAEDARRETGTGSCGHAVRTLSGLRDPKQAKEPYCPVCAHYYELAGMALRVKRAL